MLNKTFFILIFWNIIGSLFAVRTDSLLLQLAKSSNPDRKADILLQLATKSVQSDCRSTVLYLTEITDLLPHQSSDFVRANTLGLMGEVWLNCGYYDKSYNCSMNSLELFIKIDDQQKICITTINLGGVFLRLEKYDEAIRYFEDGMKLAKKLKEKGDSYFSHTMYPVYNNLGLAYGKIGKLPLAIANLESAIREVPPSKKELLAKYYYNITPFYHKLGEKHKAYDCINQSLNIYRNKNLVAEMALAEMTLARLYINDQRTSEGLNLIEQISQKVANLDNKPLQKSYYELCVDLYKQTKAYKQCNNAYEKLDSIKSIIINEDVFLQIARTNYLNDAEKAELENELLVKALRLRQRMIIIIVVSLLLILSIILILNMLRLQRSYARNRTLEKDLENKNRELVSNAMSLMHKEEYMNGIMKQCMELRENLSQDKKKALSNIIKDLSLITKGDAWVEFETRFNNVHTEFYNNLRTSCPDLSPSELKMCAFLRLNLSTKEIASLLGISDKSVDVIRARIRRKLGISNTGTNLITHLSQF